jgi:hypothetical protein
MLKGKRVEYPSDDFYDVIFKCADNKNPSDYSSDIKLLNVVWSMDGIRTLGQIARDGRYDLKELSQIALKLLDMGLIVIHTELNKYLDPRYFELIGLHLSREVGPIADILIEDKVKEMGHSRYSFPVKDLDLLIDKILEEIRVIDSNVTFESTIALKHRIKNHIQN